MRLTAFVCTAALVGKGLQGDGPAGAGSTSTEALTLTSWCPGRPGPAGRSHPVRSVFPGHLKAARLKGVSTRASRPARPAAPPQQLRRPDAAPVSPRAHSPGLCASKAPRSKPRMAWSTSKRVCRGCVVRGTYVTTARSWSRKAMCRTRQGRGFWTIPRSMIHNSPRWARGITRLPPHGHTSRRLRRKRPPSVDTPPARRPTR